MTTTATTIAVAAAYRNGMPVHDICDTFGVTRTEIATIVRELRLERGMGAPGLTAEETAALYLMLRAAWQEIERLRDENRRLSRRVPHSG